MARKTMDVAFNLLELGDAVLSIPATWLIPIAVRAQMMSSAVGGVVSLFGAVSTVTIRGRLGHANCGSTFPFRRPRLYDLC